MEDAFKTSKEQMLTYLFDISNWMASYMWMVFSL